MLGSFDNAFKKKNNFVPSEELVEAIKHNIPSNLEIDYSDDGNLIIVPSKEKNINITFSFSDEDMEYLKNVPQEKRLEYLYRTQHVASVKNAEVGDDSKKLPIHQIGKKIFSDNKVYNMEIFPPPFPAPITVHFVTVEGDCLDIKMKQVIYNSWRESKIENINYKSIKIEIYINDEDIKKSRMKFSLSSQNAKNVREAVSTAHFFRGLVNGTVKMNGKGISLRDTDLGIDNGQLEASVTFWENALKIEKKLGVTFDPSADFPKESVIFFEHLVKCLIEREPLSYKHPFNHFHVGDVTSKEIMEQTIGQGKLIYTFMEENDSAALLGTEFELYSYCELRDFVVKRVDWDTEGDGGEIIIDDAPEETWVMTRFYMNKVEADKVRKMMDGEKLLNIPKDLDNK